MSKLIHRLWSEDAGQDIAEYAVMLAVIRSSKIAFHHFKPLHLIRTETETSMTRFTPGAAFTAYFWFPGAAAAEQLGVRMSH
jgi:hypothetical protein